MLLTGLLILAALTAFGWYYTHRPTDTAAMPTDDALAANNRGVGWMEIFEYDRAEAEFQQVVNLAPGWLPGRINLGISKYNQATREKIDEAIPVFEAVLKTDPKSPHAHYCLGYLLKYDGRLDDAVAHFTAVTEIDPDDAGAWFHLGDCVGQLGQSERAVTCLEAAHRLDPYRVAASLALQSHWRATDPHKADTLLAEVEKLKLQDVSHETSHKYTEEGSKYSEVIGTPVPRPKEPTAPLPLLQPAENFAVTLAPNTRWAKSEDFGAGTVGDLRRAVRSRFGATMIRLDYNGDGRPDLFLIGAVVENGHVRDLLLRNDGGGRFTDVTTAAGLGGSRPSLGCAAADFDNDGHTDLFVSGVGVQTLFRNKGDGTFEDVTEKAGLDKLTAVCMTAAWLDLEQDSDLDLVVARFAETPAQALALLAGGQPTGAEATGGGVAVYLNVGEAIPVRPDQQAPPLTVKFQRSPAVETMFAAAGPVVGFAVTDADADHDLDVIVLEDRAVPALVLNDRLLRFHRAAVPGADPHPWTGALVLDADHGERSDLILTAAGVAPVFLKNRAAPGQPVAKLYEKGPIKSPPLRQAQAVDFDLDGWTDIIGLSDKGIPVLLHNDRGGRLAHVEGALGADRDWPADLVAMLAADLDGDGNPDLLTWSEGTGLQMRRSLGNGNRCVKVQPQGRRNRKPTPPLRTNSDGIGVRVALQTGRHWTGAENTTLTAGLGQSAGPLELGIGRESPNDVVARLHWPDLVIQAEFCSIEKTKDIWRIEENNRKPSSCPVLFTWDGEKYVYITDFLGEGSVGEMLAGGGTRPPRPEESVKIEPGLLKPRDGHYVLKVAQPMDEVIYLDRLRLDVIDHPGETCVFPDERFATGGPPPTQELLRFRERLFPISARDHRGRDVTATLRERDKKMVDGFARRSWVGFAEDHWVELDFGEQLKKIGPQDRVYLVLAGWTDYAYPESIFAANQAGVPMQPPVLERLGPDGKWTAVDEVGMPAGLPRVMTRDLTGRLAGFTGKLRIRTNLQIYWDQISLAPLLSDAPRRVRSLGVADAVLAASGFNREIAPDHTPLIEYDPERREPVAVTRWGGTVTKLGDVTELLRATDDRFAILAPGDEVTARFDARGLPPLPDGWTRSFVLRTWGYCKDSTPFTATGGAVGPLPFRAMKQYPPGPGEQYPHPDDLRRWHTRRP
jgi:hypothetical protein